MCRAPIGQTVQASVEMTGSIGDLLSNATAQAQWERDFIRDMAAVAGVDPSRIRITSVEAAADAGRRRLQAGGGIVVSFDIAPALDGSSLPISILESALVDDIEIGGLQATEGLGDFSAQAITCTQSCAAGTEDHDCDATTPCVACEPGQYTQGGESPMGRCAYCDGGFADTDYNATTRCEPCAAGSYTESVGHAGACLQCAAGKFSAAPEEERTSAETCQNCAILHYSDEGSSACQTQAEYFTCPDEARQTSNFELLTELCRPDVDQSDLPSQCYECSCQAEHYDASSYDINCWKFDKKELPEDDLLNDLSVRDIHAHLFEGKEKTKWKSTCVRCPACVNCSLGSSWEQITIKEGYGLASEGIGEGNVLDVFTCPRDGSCLGNLSIADVLAGQDRKCATGYVDASSVPFCSACMDRYSMDNNECSRCDTVRSNSVLVLSLMAGALVVGVLGSLRLRFCSHHFQVVAALLRLMWPRLSQSVNLIITNYQILSGLPQRIRIPFPEGITRFLKAMTTLINIDVLNLPGLACFVGSRSRQPCCFFRPFVSILERQDHVSNKTLTLTLTRTGDFYTKFMANMLVPLFIVVATHELSKYHLRRLRCERTQAQFDTFCILQRSMGFVKMR